MYHARMMTHFTDPLVSSKGVALLIVIWMLSSLVLIGFAALVIARSEAVSARHFREAASNRFLAEAGIEKAIMEFRLQSVAGNIENTSAWTVDGTEYHGELGKGKYVVAMTDEAGKLGINSMTKANAVILKNMLVTISGLDEEAADMITDSVLNWKEAGNQHHVRGADDEYYLSLPDPYKPGHRPFETPEELLMVKGITPDILFGKGNRKGLMPYITVFSRDGRINLMTASREVLCAIPGITPDLAQKIIEARMALGAQETGVHSFMQMIGPPASGFVTATRPNTVSIDSTGYTDNRRSGFRVVSAVRFSRGGAPRILYYRSRADIR
jgi:general secretion pathway protein K